MQRPGVRALFVSPHLDDVSLSCGGTVARMADEGSKPLVVTCFTAPPVPDEPLGELARDLHRLWQASSGDAIVVRRRAEDVAAASVLGAETVWLDHREAPYRPGYPRFVDVFSPPVKADGTLRAQLKAELMSLWSQTDAAAVYLPLAVGGHADHRLCFDVAPSLRAAGAVVYCYEDFPYCAKPGAVERRLAMVRAPLRPEVVDVTRWTDRRVAAIECYASQLAMLFGDAAPHAVTRHYAASVSPDGGCGERFWKWS